MNESRESVRERDRNFNVINRGSWKGEKITLNCLSLFSLHLGGIKNQATIRLELSLTFSCTFRLSIKNHVPLPLIQSGLSTPKSKLNKLK